MKVSELYLKLLRWGIFVSLFIPLIISSQYLSPFLFGKMIVFRSLVEIMAVIYILLIIANKKYLPKWTPIVIAFTIFTAFYALASLTAVDFTYAFWGTLERMGGLFSFLHFWVFFIILISVFGKSNTNDANRDWMKLLKLSIVVGFLSILFAYGQHFRLSDFFYGWQQPKITGTLENPAIFAGYLLFIFFLSIYFLIKPACRLPAGKAGQGRKDVNSGEKGFYASVLILGLPILHIMAIRTSVIAFWGALFFLGLFYLFFPASLAGGLKKRKIKTFVLIGLLIFLILIGFLWLNKNQPWVKNTRWLNEITGISLKTFTLQTRLWSWESGWEGWKERPILGWGPENFTLAHAKYFDSRLFTGISSQTSSRTIWDRAHNVVLETLTTMGMFGPLSYLGIFVVVYWLLIKRFKEKRIDLAFIAVFGAMLVAYFVHNFFLFDTMVNYFVFFLILGYINYKLIARRNTEEPQKSTEKSPNPILVFILVALAVLLIYKANIEPAMANYACTRAIIAGEMGDAQKAFSKYQEALSYKSPQGKYEIRYELAVFAVDYNGYLVQEKMEPNQEVLNYAIKEMKKNIETHPLDYPSYFNLGKIYIFLIKIEPSYGEQAEAAIMKALAINNKNPQVWYELGRIKLSQEKFDETIEAFEQALELNPEVPESHLLLAGAYFRAGNIEQAAKYTKQAVGKCLKKDYPYSVYYEAVIKLQPKNTQFFYAFLAAAYKEVGDIENAILYIQKAREIAPNSKEKLEAFIKSLNH